MKKLLMGCMAALAALISLVGCEQDRVVYGGPNYLMFSDTIYYCPVQETNEIFNVPVSATETADRDRTFAVEVIDKKSNAVEGKHYKILSNTVTIKAGERAANVEVEGLYEKSASTIHWALPCASSFRKTTAGICTVQRPKWCCARFARSTSTTSPDTAR